MEVSRIENLPPPPGIISSIKAGFDTIASHITAILLPLLLNLFIWLGPRLRMNALFDSIVDDVVLIWQRGGVSAQDIQRVLDWYQNTIPTINLFWFLRTLPVGISSLLQSQNVTQTPLGEPAILQVSALSFPGWIILLTVLGWIGGALYFRSVAWVVVSDVEQRVQPLHAVVQTILVSIACAILLMIIGIPLLVVLFLVLQLNAFLANVFVLLVCLVSMRLVVPVFFWPHGVFVKRQNVFTSMLSSLQLMRFTLPTSSLFVLTVFLLAFGLNYLWRIPPQNSWMTLVGILGHSFVTTALLAGSFIYYRDMSVWVQGVIERLRPNHAVKKA
ncbi:MAG: hypothetical protein QY332_07190 [Anaerolineales bacterium]|nr:MAG: hypothetical protein QY332_07190 [Anaerolineales bacterium]